jgi:threonylcarbamoyladenosine tRNA methylthiotransferase MtaB
MQRVSTYTLGCKLNYTETSTIESHFERQDFEVVPFGEPADVTVINTCTVTNTAESKCRKIIRRARRANPDAFIAVTGCYAQLRPEDIAAIDGVDIVLGAQEKFQLLEIVDSTFQKNDRTQVEVSCIDDFNSFGPAYSSGERTRSFLKVQDGCDYGCTFCTIPAARGDSRSQSIEDTVTQAREIAQKGYHEIVLTGVNIGLYGQKFGSSLLELIRRLDRVKGIERYRISSIEPNLLTPAIVDFVAESRAFLPHFHMPLQSGDNEVLRKMARRYDRELYASRVDYIRSVMPDACIGVDAIVGFPAETEERFENSYEFISELPVSYIHAFTYSERPDTPAVEHLEKMGERIPKPERKRRNKMLRILSRKKEHAHYETHLATRRPVLWEDTNNDGTMYGYTDNYIRMETDYDERKTNSIEHVYLDQLTDNGTVAAGDGEYIPIA